MEKIIKQFNFILLAGTMTLVFGCDLEVVEDPATSSPDYAPSSIENTTLRCTITSGSGDFATTGTFPIEFPSATSYILTGDGAEVGDDAGTYIYVKLFPNVASIVLTSTTDSKTRTVTATFSSSTAGTYEVKEATSTGVQHGDFTVIE